jgi:hypothetical protein
MPAKSFGSVEHLSSPAVEWKLAESEVPDPSDRTPSEGEPRIAETITEVAGTKRVALVLAGEVRSVVAPISRSHQTRTCKPNTSLFQVIVNE